MTSQSRVAPPLCLLCNARVRRQSAAARDLRQQRWPGYRHMRVCRNPGVALRERPQLRFGGEQCFDLRLDALEAISTTPRSDFVSAASDERVAIRRSSATRSSSVIAPASPVRTPARPGPPAPRRARAGRRPAGARRRRRRLRRS